MKQINALDYSKEILEGIKKGILITTEHNGKKNAMTISWGSFGIEWNKLIFITYVRESRFTRFQLDANPEFTVNIPMGEFDKKILGFCGTKSGKDHDKFAELGLTSVESVNVSVPGIKELPLTLECKVIYKELQSPNTLPKALYEQFYPQDVDGSFHSNNRDSHIAYYGEVVGAYIVE